MEQVYLPCAIDGQEYVCYLDHVLYWGGFLLWKDYIGMAVMVMDIKENLVTYKKNSKSLFHDLYLGKWKTSIRLYIDIFVEREVLLQEVVEC